MNGECGTVITRWRFCNGPEGHAGECGNPWYDPDDPDPQEHAEYLGEVPWSDRVDD